jgi:hypothetical protein
MASYDNGDFIAVNQLLSKNSLASMHNRLVFYKTVNKSLDSQWGSEFQGFRQGDSFRINRPARFKSVKGNQIGQFDPVNGVWLTGAFVEDPIFLTVSTDNQRNISAQFDSKQITLALNDEKSRLGEPVGKQLATDTEMQLLGETVIYGGQYIIATGNTTLGTKIGTQDLLNAQAVLDTLTAPDSNRSCLIPAGPMAELSRENLNLFTPTINDSSDGPYIKGRIKEFANATMYSYNLLPSYDLPILSATFALTAAVVNGVPGSSSSITFTVPAGDVNKVLPAGTIMEFAAFDSVNPETRKTVNKKYSFAVRSATYSPTTGWDVVFPATTGPVTVYLDDAAKIYGPTDAGNRQNITALPGIGALVSVVGSSTTVAKSYKQVCMYAEDAFTCTIIPLSTELPGAYAARADWDGVSVRTAVQTVIGSDSVVHRFDILAKGILQRDQYACRILVPVA